MVVYQHCKCFANDEHPWIEECCPQQVNVCTPGASESGDCEHFNFKQKATTRGNAPCREASFAIPFRGRNVKLADLSLATFRFNYPNRMFHTELPVKENGVDVGQQRANQGESGRHMDVQPHLNDG